VNLDVIARWMHDLGGEASLRLEADENERAIDEPHSDAPPATDKGLPV